MMTCALNVQLSPVLMVHSLAIGPLLKSVSGQLLADVDAKHIASEACHENIISKEYETSIRETKSTEKANEILYEHLCQQATKETLEQFCRIMTKDKAYARMRTFGQMLQDKVSNFGCLILPSIYI